LLKRNHYEIAKFGKFYPLVGEKLKRNYKAQFEDDPQSPALYDVVPVCQHCFYIYTLYRFKKEKLKLPRPLFEKVVFF